jgi:type III secretion translocon protein HrpF
MRPTRSRQRRSGTGVAKPGAAGDGNSPEEGIVSKASTGVAKGVAKGVASGVAKGVARGVASGVAKGVAKGVAA